jgi:transaldolase/glucose-6-phosphate isomerase
MSTLTALNEIGQAVWLDYIDRRLLTSGSLSRLVASGVRGVTSNPSIFHAAITGSDDYDSDILACLLHGIRDSTSVFEELAVRDIQLAADVLAEVWESTGGADGYVSLEVSPLLADDTDGTIAEARRLWKAVGRPNLMIKVPATAAGVPAIEQLISEGINVNVTLMFSLSHYERVAAAYLRGLERRTAPGGVASVASFFISRLDTIVDRQLEAIGTPEALALRGRAAVANAKVVYRRFSELFGASFEEQRSRGGRVQRCLWASTSTKNPDYPDVKYVDSLIGPDTVNTVPMKTLEAFIDHGTPEATVTVDVGAAEATLTRLRELGIDLDAVTERLQEDGVAAFASSFAQLLAALEDKVRALGGPGALNLGDDAAVHEAVRGWSVSDLSERLWRRDTTLWATGDVPELADRLGWLDLPVASAEEIEPICSLADGVRRDALDTVLLLGMGGSSLAPEVFQRTFGSSSGYPHLVVLDSTHPDAVAAVRQRLTPERTLVVVSSKSGTTVETISLFHAFWALLSEHVAHPGNHFIAITDPGSALESLGRERGFRRVLLAPRDVGGRFSALSVFGLAPAGLIGADVERALAQARAMAERCQTATGGNPGVALGVALGELALAGRDKLTLVTAPALQAFPHWIEQLVAESTGKDGRGIVPVRAKHLHDPSRYGSDRFFVLMTLGTVDPDAQGRLQALADAGHPTLHLHLGHASDLGGEMLRWEIATAIAGAILGVHPFNQPDVQLAKTLAREAMSGSGGATARPPQAPDDALNDIRAALRTAGRETYIAVQAFVAPSTTVDDELDRLAEALEHASGLAVTVGYGPRFLHSTGQLHKGGPDTGVFLQLVDEPGDTEPIPELGGSFGQLFTAQCTGDARALEQRGRQLIRIDVSSDVGGSIRGLAEALALGR